MKETLLVTLGIGIGLLFIFVQITWFPVVTEYSFTDNFYDCEEDLGTYSFSYDAKDKEIEYEVCKVEHGYDFKRKTSI